MLTKEQSDMAERCTPFYDERPEEYETYSNLVRYWWVAEIVVDIDELTFDEYSITYPATTVKEAHRKAQNRVKRDPAQQVHWVRPATVNDMIIYLREIQSHLNYTAAPDDELPF